MKARVAILFLSLFCVLNAQERLGMANSNYVPGTAIFLNPSASVDSRTYQYFNIAGANASAMNNLAYLPDFLAWDLLKLSDVPAHRKSTLRTRKFAYACAEVDGLAFLISKRNYGAGFFVRGRTVFDSRRIPYRLAGALLFGDSFIDLTEPDVDMRRAKISNMTWVEYGVNFGLMTKRERKELYTFGGNLRYLTGIGFTSAYLRRLKGSYSDTAVNLETLESTIKNSRQGWNTGKGFALDFGFTYKKMLDNVEAYYVHSKRSNCKYIDYKYKIGFTLRDLGYINFVKNTNVMNINGSGFYSFRQGELVTVESLRSQLEFSEESRNIMALLPAIFVFQYDYNFENSIYFNITATKNLLPVGLTAVHGPDLISFCPRFERRWFGASMPLTFHKFLYPQLGFALRLAGLTVGFDNVIALVKRKNTYGLGAYFSLGIPLYRNRACDVTKRSLDDCVPRFLKRFKPFKKKPIRNLFRRNKTYSR